MHDSPHRRDARENRAKLIAAARTAYSAGSGDPATDDIAALAGVGAATLYRHFPRREDLVAAVFEQIVETEIAPLVIGTPEPGTSSIEALREFFGRTLALIAAERGLLAAAGAFQGATNQIVESLLPRLGALLAQAQKDGNARKDLVEDDLVPIVIMLASTVAGTESGNDGWRRYLALVFDAMTTPAPTGLPRVDSPSATLIRASPLLGR